MQLKCDRKRWLILRCEFLVFSPYFRPQNSIDGQFFTTKTSSFECTRWIASETCHTWEPQTLVVKSSFPFFHLSVWGCSICSFRHNFHRSVNNATLQPPSLRWWLFSGKMEWKTRKENTFLISGLGGGLRQFLFWLLGYFFLGTWGYSRLHNQTCKHCLTICSILTVSW